MLLSIHRGEAVTHKGLLLGATHCHVASCKRAACREKKSDSNPRRPSSCLTTACTTPTLGCCTCSCRHDRFCASVQLPRLLCASRLTATARRSQNVVVTDGDREDVDSFLLWLLYNHGMHFSPLVKGHYVRQIYVNVNHPNIHNTAHGRGYGYRPM